MKKRPDEWQKAIEALSQIAMMGHGMKADVIDWAAIGKNAVYIARETIAGKCESCGHAKPFEPRHK